LWLVAPFRIICNSLKNKPCPPVHTKQLKKHQTAFHENPNFSALL